MDRNMPRILLVEDEPAHAELIHRAFASWPEPVELTVACTLAEARARLAETAPDLVIADLRLPDGDGVGLLPAQGQEPPLPLVVLTAHGNEPTAVEAIKRGALDYVVKSEFTLADTPHIAQRALREWHHITARRRAEDALRHERDSARQYLAVAGVVMVAIDPDERVALINRKGCEVLGYDEHELLGANWFETCLPESSREQVRGVFRRLLGAEAKTVEWFENPVLTKAGHERLILWHNTALRDGQGRITGTLSSGEDITERKRAEEALRESEMCYRRIVETAHEGIWVIDAHSNTIFVNRRMADILGYTVEEMMGKSVFAFMEEQSRAIEEAHLERRRQGHAEQHDCLFRRNDGSNIWAIVSSNAIYDEAGQYLGALGMITDITKRKRAEQALQESETRYRLLAENAKDVIWTADLQLRCTYVSPSVELLRGFTAEESLGQTIEQMLTPASAELARKTLAEELQRLQNDPNASPAIRTVELEHLCKDGSTVWAEVKANFLLGDQGRPISILGVTRDITQRRRAEEAYRLLVDHSLQGLVIFQEGRVVFANQAMPEISGYSVDEMLALTPEQVQAFVYPEDRDLVWGRHRDRLNGEPLPERYQFRGIRKDASVCWLEIHANRIEYRGKPAIQAAYVDITQRKQAEEKLRGMEAQLAHVARLSALGEMVAGIAHEVNQPLYSILNFAKASGNLLAAEEPPNLTDLRQWNDEIAAAAARAGEILNRLRTFARRTEPQHSLANLSEVVEEAFQLVAFDLRQRRIAVEFLFFPAPLFVQADRVQIQQVLVNLLLNAWEAIQRGSVETPQVVIRTHLSGENVEVSVADNGPGLPPDNQLNIFDPFVTTKPDGLGMGLAISKSIVEAHGGTLWATSNLEGGAIFHFTVPLATGCQTDVE
jgi:two-component system NtrC family sensor kinase